MGDDPHATFLGKRKFSRSLRLWKVLTLALAVVAITITAVFVWYVVTHEADKVSKEKHASCTDDHDDDVNMACPRLPTLFPLPKPTPKRITEVFGELESTLSASVDKDSSLPAISMSVFYQDDILWSGHFGSKVYQQPNLKPNDTTIYRIGSVTKIFAVLMMFKLYEEGKIASIDDPLSKYAPDFDIKNPFTNDSITLREIASQMSGLPREAPCLFNCNTTSADQLALLKNRTLVLPPWREPSYSNVGYALLGRLLTENLLNQTFESWTRGNILKPLGMSNTGFEITDELQKNMAFPYLPNGKKMPFMEIGWLAPAGQMYSTIEDLAKLGMMFAQPDKQKLFKPATLREMMTPKDIAPDGVTVWGSPFEMSFKKNFLIRTKGGNIDTYSALFIVIPELAFGANILTSTPHYGLPAAYFGSTLLYDQLPPRLNETLFVIQKDSHFPVDPSAFIGTFQVNQTNGVFGTTRIYNVSISTYQNMLPSTVFPGLQNAIFEIRYVGENLVFQARIRTPGMSCFIERVGTLADMYYDPPDKEKLSHGFRIPQLEIVAKRINATNDIAMNARDDSKEGFLFNQFKSAI